MLPSIEPLEAFERDIVYSNTALIYDAGPGAAPIIAVASGQFESIRGMPRVAVLTPLQLDDIEATADAMLRSTCNETVSIEEAERYFLSIGLEPAGIITLSDSTQVVVPEKEHFGRLCEVVSRPVRGVGASTFGLVIFNPAHVCVLAKPGARVLTRAEVICSDLFEST